MRTRRNKDGEGSSGDRAAKKIITNCEQEFNIALGLLIDTIEPGERIYSTVDARNFEKAIREFKRRQLERDYDNEVNRHGFYCDSFNQMVSCLQGPTARASSLFLWDCDSVDEYFNLSEELIKTVRLSVVAHSYLTKNGGHIITRPFEYPKLLDPKFHPLLQKNAMMLWAY